MVEKQIIHRSTLKQTIVKRILYECVNQWTVDQLQLNFFFLI